MSSERVLIALVALLGVACAPEPEPTRFGLPAVHLYVDPTDRSRLVNGTFTETSVPAEIYLGAQLHVGKVSVAGRSSVDDLKKSLDLELSGARRGLYRLDAMSRDPSALRAVLAFRAHGLAGIQTLEPAHVVLFLNDAYLGLFTLHEVIDPEFVAERGARAAAIYAARRTLADLESTANLDVAFSGRVGTETYADLEHLVSRVLSGGPTGELGSVLDVDNALRYMAVAAFTGNRDGIDNNYVLVRREDDPRFAVWPWDLDYTFHETGPDCDGALLAGNAMMRRLLADPGSRARFTDHLLELDDPVVRDDLVRLLDERAPAIAEAYRLDPYLGRIEPPFEDQVAALRTTLLSPRCDPGARDAQAPLLQ